MGRVQNVDSLLDGARLYRSTKLKGRRMALKPISCQRYTMVAKS